MPVARARRLPAMNRAARWLVVPTDPVLSVTKDLGSIIGPLLIFQLLVRRLFVLGCMR